MVIASTVEVPSSCGAAWGGPRRDRAGSVVPGALLAVLVRTGPPSVVGELCRRWGGGDSRRRY